MIQYNHTPSNLDLVIDLRASAPAYVQIMMGIEGRILDGSLTPGEQLPTVRQLAAELAINFNTVARAYRMLDQAGLITTQQGRGTFVLDSQEAHGKLRREVLNDLTSQYLAEIDRLGLTPEEVRASFQQQFERWQGEGEIDAQDLAQE